jgi:hypothetical protein
MLNSSSKQWPWTREYDTILFNVKSNEALKDPYLYASKLYIFTVR